MTIFIDAATARVSLTPSSSDVGPYTDANTGITKLTPLNIDVGPYTDSNLPKVKFTPLNVDRGPYSDSNIAKITLTPKNVDVGPYTDINTTKVTFTPKNVDVGPYTDINTEIVLLIPSGIDVGPYYDSNTAKVKLTTEIYEDKFGGVVTGFRVPSNTIEYAAYLLNGIERDIQKIKSNSRPTFPIYDSADFPQDNVIGQPAIALDGSFWIYTTGEIWKQIADA